MLKNFVLFHNHSPATASMMGSDFIFIKVNWGFRTFEIVWCKRFWQNRPRVW